MAESKLVKLLKNDPKFFYYNGNPGNSKNGGGLGNFTQKSIRFGDDRPNGGDSGQPYIASPIPERRTPTGMDDGYIRGGMTTADRASIIDKERINKFLTDRPKGTLFIQRQIKLQFSNPRLEVKKYGNGATGFGIFNGLIDLGATAFNIVNELAPAPTRLYNNGFNTLAQVGANAFGQHFNRHGMTPVQDDNTKYFAIVRHNNENGNNRLVSLKNKLIKVIPPPSKFLNSLNFIFGNINALFGTRLNTNSLQPNELTIDNYLGGPGSIYGSGRTLIRRFDITSNTYNNQQPTARGAINYAGELGVSNQYFNPTDGDNNFTVNDITVQSPTRKPSQIDKTAVNYKGGTQSGANGTSASPTTRDYDRLKDAIKTSINQNNFNTKSVNINREDSTYRYYGARRIFDSNSIAIYNNTLDFDRHDPDLMTIVFQAINPFGDPTTGYHFRFPAYIKGFKDSFDATWNEYNYAGRSETFYTYGKFKRAVNFSLDIPCFNKTQLFEKHRALGQLAATTAGSYNTNGLLGGVLLRAKVGGYLNNEYAILNSISYDIPDDSSWDLDGSFDSVGKTSDEITRAINDRNQLAMYIKTNISLTIIHKDLPQYQVPDVKGNEKAGFFGHLNNPIKGYLDPNYKKELSTKRP
jgi:hypothetical protein